MLACEKVANVMPVEGPAEVQLGAHGPVIEIYHGQERTKTTGAAVQCALLHSSHDPSLPAHVHP